MFSLEIKFDASRMEQALLRAFGADVRRAALAKAATRVAAAARRDIMDRLPQVFDRPTPFTMHSVRYVPATPDMLEARVYISEDSNSGLSPRKYLGPEIMGGARHMKAGERRLLGGGLMTPAQRVVPSAQIGLDAYGNVAGSQMVKILSRLGAFGEQGYTANAGDKRKRKLRKAKLAVASTKTDFFIAHDKRDGTPLGVWQLVGTGRVRPMLIFVNRQPHYQPRFRFKEMAYGVFRARWSQELSRALLESAR